MSEPKIIDRMKKLLALSESTNEHEAMSATRKLHAMLAKHNVSINSLNEKEETVGKDCEIVSCKPWKRRIAMNIAELYFCSFYFASGTKKNYYYFVGTESNRTFALHIFKMVVKVVEQESRRECTKEFGKRNSSFINSFRVGAMARICQRCKDMVGDGKEGKLTDEDGSLLPALLSVYESHQINISAWLSENTQLKKVSNRTKANNQLGYSKGQETGDRVQLNRTIQSNASPKMLGSK
tara:strand:+ start:54 stop:767 length:714 start_codon:yes stop_codon:yes gene_type:complete